MKKISLALAVTSALGASAANAAIMGEYGNALLVPWVTAQTTNAGEIRGTAIALTSCAAGTVYWSFYDTESVKLLDSEFPMTKNDQESIIWNETGFGNGGFLDRDGYLIFFLDTGGPNNGPRDGRLTLDDSTCLSGNAFFVDTVANDVAFVPTFPMNVAWGDFDDTYQEGDTDVRRPITDYDGVDNLIDVPASEIWGLWAGAQAYDTVHMRYLVDVPADPADGTDNTQIFVWTTDKIKGARTIQQYDNTQTRFSLTLFLDDLELHILNPETNDNFSVVSPFTDGFYEWTLAADDDLSALNRRNGGLATWSVVNSPRFQATQTLLNPIFKPHISPDRAVPDVNPVGTERTLTDNVYRFNVLERYNPEGNFQHDNVGDGYGPGSNSEDDPAP